MPSKLTYDKLVDKLLKGQWKKDFEEMARNATASLKQVENAFKRINEQAKALGTDARSLLDLKRLQTENEKLKVSYNRLKQATDELSQASKVQQQIENALIRERAKQSQGNIKRANELKREREETKRLQIEQQKLDGSYRRTSGVLRNLVQSVKGYIGASLGIYALVSVFKNIFETAKKLDTLRFTLRSIITDTNELGQTQAYIIKLSKDYGQELLSLIDNYSRFKAAIKSSNLSVLEGQKIFESFTKVGAILGKSAADMDLIFLALEQMISKGTVTTEELRRQLGERLPGAFNIAAKSMGVTVKELNKMLRDGNVITEEMLPNFAREMEKAFGAENVTQVNNLTAATNRLKTSWVEFVDVITTENKVVFTGILNFLSGAMQGIKAIMDDISKSEYEIKLKKTFEDAKKASDEFMDSIMKSSKDEIKIREEKIKVLQNEIDTNIGNLKILRDNNAEIKTLNEEIDYYRKNVREGVSGKNLTDSLSKEIERANSEIIKFNFNIARLEADKQKIEKKASETMLIYKKDDLKKINDSINEYMTKEAWYTNYVNNLSIQLTDAESKLENHGEKTLGIIESLNKRIEDLNKKVLSALSLNDIKILNNAIKDIQWELFFAKKGEEAPIVKELEKLSSIGGGIDQQKQMEDNLKQSMDNEIRIVREGNEDYWEAMNDLYNRLGIDAKNFYRDDLKILKQEHEAGRLSDEQYIAARLELWSRFNKAKLEASKFAMGQINELLSTVFDAMETEAQKEFDLHDNAISELKGRLEKEKQLKDEGSNSDYDRLVTQMADEKKLRDKALEDLKKARKAQAAIDLAQQTGSLVTAAANIFKGTAKDPVTTVLAVGLIAGMIASFIGFKNKIKSIESDYQEYGKGGWIKGKSHKQGGVNINAEGDEFMVNKKSAKQSKKLLESVNKGIMTDQTIMYLSAMNQIDLNKQPDKSDDIINELKRNGDASMKLVNLYKNDVKIAYMPNGDVMIISNGGLRKETYTRKK